MDIPNVPNLLHAVLDAHDRAIASLNTANTAIGEAAAAFGVAVTANGVAIAEALAANRAAITLLYTWETDHRDPT